MTKVQLSIAAGLLVMFLLVNQLAGGDYGCAYCPGGLPWYGWAGSFIALLVAGVAFARRHGEHAHQLPHGERVHQLLKESAPAPPVVQQEPDAKWTDDLRRKYDWDGPERTHPVIITERCIGCHACVEACPHDVLTISITKNQQPVASVVDPELCMDDNSCEAICPANPKACVVVNTENKIKSPRAPRRNSRYMSSLDGCYIIGDASGKPLIRYAANEGTTVMVHIALELHDADGNASQLPVDYDVAIIGAGPAGLSAAIMAKKLKLSCIVVEQNTVMSIIKKFSERKYVSLKPETTRWDGAIHLPGLEKYTEEVLEEMLDEPDRAHAAGMLGKERAVARRLAEKGEAAELGSEDELDPQIAKKLAAARQRYQQALEAEANGELAAEERQRLINARKRFAALMDGEQMNILEQLLDEESAGLITDEKVSEKARLNLARRQYGGRLKVAIEAGKLTQERFEALADARCKIAGDQREVLINTWKLNIKENDIQVNEKQNCKMVQKAEDGDYLIVQTEKREKGKTEIMTYRARRVVLAIGNSSSPETLRIGDEGINDARSCKKSDNIRYQLSDPMEYSNSNLIVVGGGNSAVEAAVALVASGQDTEVIPPTVKRQQSVTLLVRGSGLKTDVKFRNKQQLYQCIERGLIELCFNTEITELRDKEVVVTTKLVNGKKDSVKPYDFIFALIGSKRPPALLEQIKVKMLD